MKVKKQRRKYTAAFKSKVALEALDYNVTLASLGRRYDVPPGLIGQWKKSVVENSHRIFEDSNMGKDARDSQIEALNRKVESLTAEYEFLKNCLSVYNKKDMK